MLLRGRHSEVVFQMRDEPRDHRQGHAFPGPEHEFTLQSIQRECIHDQHATSAVRPHFTGKFCTLAQDLSQDCFWESSRKTVLLRSGGNYFSIQFLGGLESCLIDTACILVVTFFLMLFEWHI